MYSRIHAITSTTKNGNYRLDGTSAVVCVEEQCIVPVKSLTFVWFDRPGESSPEKDCCW